VIKLNHICTGLSIDCVYSVGMRKLKKHVMYNIQIDNQNDKGKI